MNASNVNVSATVVPGRGKGRELGFPTANLKLETPIPPGIYTGRAETGGKSYVAAVYIPPKGDILEAHLVKFSGDLYGKTITVEVGKKIRDVQKFTNREILKAAIKADVDKILTLDTFPSSLHPKS